MSAVRFSLIAASSAPNGKPWDARRKLVSWNGKSWGGADVPDIRPDVLRPTPLDDIEGVGVDELHPGRLDDLT